MIFTMGIDPGSAKSSAYAFYSPEEYHVFDDATLTSEVRSAILKFKPSLCLLEQVWIQPKRRNLKGAATFMKSVGKIQGIIETLDIPLQELVPTQWRKEVKVPPKSDKIKILDIARKRFPDAELHLMKHEHRAEALLMALCAYQLFKGA